MSGHEELGIAERLQGADAQDDLLASVLGSVDLPVELVGDEATRRRLETVPVGAQADQLEWILEQSFERSRGVESERIDLPWTKADPEEGRGPGLHGHAAPTVGQRADSTGDAQLARYREREQTGDYGGSRGAETRHLWG